MRLLRVVGERASHVTALVTAAQLDATGVGSEELATRLQDPVPLVHIFRKYFMMANFLDDLVANCAGKIAEGPR
jgi:hypothetical protein